jgi:hypothetical protein
VIGAAFEDRCSIAGNFEPDPRLPANATLGAVHQAYGEFLLQASMPIGSIFEPVAGCPFPGQFVTNGLTIFGFGYFGEAAATPITSLPDDWV